MKFLFLILCPVFCLSQKKGDNTIKSGFRPAIEIKSILFKNGYSLIGNDTAYLVTAQKNIKYSEIKLLIFRTDSATYIKGDLASIDNEFTSIYFGGMNKSPLRRAWNGIERIAKLISPDIEYIKQ